MYHIIFFFQVIAQKTAENDIDEIIKEKILQDMKSGDIFGKFLKIAPSFSNSSDYESLSLQELTFIWKECEKFNSDFREDFYSKIQITDCHYCGSNHNKNECAAKSKECSKCKKLGHFSWRCSSDSYIPCDLCGEDHIDNHQTCPADKHQCNNCQKSGHFSFRCKTRRNSKRKN